MSSTDPWNLLGLEYPSQHCEGKKSKVVQYDHTGAILTECTCGERYWHDYGAHGKKPTKRALAIPVAMLTT
jgi:hypothetical protein